MQVTVLCGSCVAEGSELDALLDRLLDGESLCADEIEIRLKQRQRVDSGGAREEGAGGVSRQVFNKTSSAIDAASVRSASPASLFQRQRSFASPAPSSAAPKVFCSCPVVAQCIDSSVSLHNGMPRRLFAVDAAAE